MKAIKLCYEDPCVFGTYLTLSRCDFVKDNMDQFMLMHKTQGQTFWLRFLVNFRCYVEDKLTDCGVSQCEIMVFIKSFHFIYIYIHKIFIEGSSMTVKKFVNNLIFLGQRSPQLVNFDPQKWLFLLSKCKNIEKTLNNLLGLPMNGELDEFVVLIYTILSDFFASLSSVFELWYFSCDLTEEESKGLDSKIIYWAPPFEFRVIEPLCFDKYVASYWKEELQRMLLADGIHFNFNSHRTKSCCGIFSQEKNFFNIFMFEGQQASHILSIFRDTYSQYHNKPYYDVIMTELFNLRPQTEKCKTHKKCFLKISHDASCLEPYICRGCEPCDFSCETSLKSENKRVKNYELDLSVDVFKVKNNTRDVATAASEVCARKFETFVHIPSELIQHYSLVNELKVLEMDCRKAEAVNRLRKKLRHRHDDGNFFAQEDFQDRLICRNMMEAAEYDMQCIESKYCVSEKHNCMSCDCFRLLVTSKCNDSKYVFGRVVSLMKKPAKNQANSRKKCQCQFDELVSQHVDPSNDISKEIKSKTGLKAENKPYLKLEVKSNVKKCSVDGFKSDSRGSNTTINDFLTNSESVGTEIECMVNFKTDKNEKKNVSSAIHDSGLQGLNNKTKSVIDSNQDSKSNIKIAKNAADSKSEMQLSSKSTLNIDTKNEGNLDPKSSSTSNKIKTRLLGTVSSEPNIDEVEEILKFIKLNDSGSTTVEKGEDICKKDVNDATKERSVDTVVDSFFDLIGIKSSTVDENRLKGGDKNEKIAKLKICAYCQKKETKKKSFKRCSKCKEENFPVHRFYCSRECLLEDWMESHQEEHLLKQKQSL